MKTKLLVIAVALRPLTIWHHPVEYVIVYMSQSKIHPAIRLVAAGCVLLWLSAIAYCPFEPLIEGAQHSHGHGGTDQMPGEDGTAVHSHDSDNNRHDSHPHDDGAGVCCSTLHATVQTPSEMPANPDFHILAFLSFVLNAHDLVCVESASRFDRHTKGREWVFKPELCLGPAFRSHAPPSLN